MVLGKFKDQPSFVKAVDLLDAEWKEILKTMTAEEIAGRFLSLSFPDIFVEKPTESLSPRTKSAEGASGGYHGRREGGGRDGRRSGGGFGGSRGGDRGGRGFSRGGGSGDAGEVRPEKKGFTPFGQVKVRRKDRDHKDHKPSRGPRPNF